MVPPHSPKSQVTLFIALGIVVVILVAVLLLPLRNRQAGPEDGTTTLSAEAFQSSLRLAVQSCLQETSLRATREMGLSEGESDAPIASYVRGQMPLCLDNFNAFKEEGFSVETGELAVTATVSANALVVDLDYPVTLTRGSITVSTEGSSYIMPRGNSVTLRQGEDTYVVSADNRLELTVPEGTSATRGGSPVAALELRVLDRNFEGLSNGVVAGMLAYDVLPAGTRFSGPVTLVYHYEDKEIPPTILEQDVRLGYWEPDTGVWVALETEVDRVQNTLTAEVSHLTAFAAVLRCEREQSNIFYGSPYIFLQDCAACQGWSLDVPEGGQLGKQSDEILSGTGKGTGGVCTSLTRNDGDRDCDDCNPDDCNMGCPPASSPDPLDPQCSCMNKYYYYTDPTFTREGDAEIEFEDGGDTCIWTKEGREPRILVTDDLDLLPSESGYDIVLVGDCAGDLPCEISGEKMDESVLSFNFEGKNLPLPSVKEDACLGGKALMRFTGFGVSGGEVTEYECLESQEGQTRDDLPVVGGEPGEMTSAVCECETVGSTRVCTWQPTDSDENPCPGWEQYDGKCYVMNGSVDTRNKDLVDRYGDFPEMQYDSDMDFEQTTPLDVFGSRLEGGACWLLTEAKKWIQPRCEHPDFYVPESAIQGATEVPCPELGPATGRPEGGAATCGSTSGTALGSADGVGGVIGGSRGPVTEVCGGDDFVKGMDVSYWQGVIDWQKVAGDGIKFAFIRASYGTYYVEDEQFDNYWTGAKEAGVLRGAYHFLRMSDDAGEQARNFVALLKADKGELPPVLDVEVDVDHKAYEREVWNNAIDTWIDIVESGLSTKVMVYTSPSFGSALGNAELADNPLWIAHWGVECPRISEPWNEWLFWQTCGSCLPVEGIDIEGNGGKVDEDVFRGTIAQLRALK